MWKQVAVVAEWLRRLTRNQIPSGSVGSSPTDRVKELFFLFLKKVQKVENFLEPAMFCHLAVLI